MNYMQITADHPEFRWEKVDDYYASENTGNAGELSRHTAFVHIPAGETVCDGMGRRHRAPQGCGPYTLWMYTSGGTYAFCRWEEELQ